MAFYSDFKNLTTSLTLTSMSEFASVAVGTQLERSTGDTYEKASDGTLFKVARTFYSKTQANSAFFDIGGDTVTGPILASVNNSYDIGSATYSFKDIFGATFSGVSEFASNIKVGGVTYAPSTTLANNTVALRNGNGDIVMESVVLGDWTITESTGVIYFTRLGVNKMKMDASGNLTVTGNLTAYGSV
jgi:hypothetical protein